MNKTILILDNLRSVENTASIFRTADAFAVEKIYLCGTTPTPIDRFQRERKDFAKVSLGAEKTINYEYVETTTEAIKKCKGYKIIALEQTPTSKNISEIQKEDIALILGPERTGMSMEILKQVDEIVEIPMYGKKESLNVSVACGIALYSIRS